MRGEVKVKDMSVDLAKAKHTLKQLSLSSVLEKALMDTSSTTTQKENQLTHPQH